MARPTRRPGNLPAEATSFVGRRRELTEIRNKLAQGRLISLVGPGGVGKTRLAVRAAADLARGFRGGGWLVELAEVVDPALVASAVMAALDLRDQAGGEPLGLVLSYLRDAELLLVVDNCEHLVDAAAQVVTEIMRAAPGVRVIATSREPLSVAGEHLVPVPPLELPPPPGAATSAELRRSEAVALFAQRAAAASGAFGMTAANEAAVADLCRRLDGLPLAIELAAVRTRALSPGQILARLSDRFGLLTGGVRGALPRHQTLRTTIEWSHDMLPVAERAVLRRCCAFAGRFTLEDAESVCTLADVPTGQVLDAMASLVDKSLVVREDAGGAACYRLHETMREFARLKLAEAGEAQALELRCADYYYQRGLANGGDSRYRLAEWLTWADLEIDNIRAVLRQCLARGDAERGVTIAVSLGWYWITRAATEGMRWLAEFTACDGGNPYAAGWAQFIRGFLAVLKADQAAASPALAAAIAAARQGQWWDMLTQALSMASIAANLAGDRASARRLIEEAAAVPADPAGTVAVLQARAFYGLFESDVAAVREAATEGARLARLSGDLYAEEMMHLNLCSAALIAGDLAESQPLLAAALRIAHRIDDRVGQFYLLDACGYHAALSGRSRVAARLLGAAHSVRAGVGANVMPFHDHLMTRARESATTALGAARFAAEFEAGTLLDRDAAVDLALGGTGGPAAPAPAAAPAAAGAGPLAKREAEVARLITDGLTNKQIGARLFLSERTVDSHVRSILNKLGVNSRAQIAAWMSAPDR